MAVACTPRNLGEDEIEKRSQAIKLTKEYGFKGLSRKKALSLVEPQNQDDNDLIETILQMYVDVGEEAFFKHFYSTIIRTDISQKLIDSGLDIAFVYASGDRLVSSEYMNEFSKRAEAKIYFSQIEAQTHMLPLERPKEIKQEVLNFFLR